MTEKQIILFMPLAFYRSHRKGWMLPWRIWQSFIVSYLKQQ